MKRDKKSCVVIIIALCVLAFSGFQLYRIFRDYKASDDEYDKLKNEYVRPAGHGEDTDGPDAPEGDGELYEDADPPLVIDWDGLKAVNEDVVGWIYVDAEPAISYPVVQGKDNEEYLHMTYERSYLYAGSIFLNSQNTPDFSDASSFIYGHNMRSGSMFGLLKTIMNQDSYDASPYFWILTPEGDYRYHIFSEFATEDGTDTYTVFREGGEKFLKWAEKMKEQSAVSTGTELKEDDHVAVLSTCIGSGSNQRHVIMGRMCSSARPRVHDYFEDDIYTGFRELYDDAFDDSENESYLLKAGDAGRMIATRGYDTPVLYNDSWNELFLRKDGMLIHYELLSGTDISKEIAATDGAWRKSDTHYHDLENGKIFTEYLKNGFAMKYRTNTYKVGKDTYGREVFGVIDTGQNTVLKITLSEVRKDGTALKADTKELGKIIDLIVWEKPAETDWDLP